MRSASITQRNRKNPCSAQTCCFASATPAGRAVASPCRRRSSIPTVVTARSVTKTHREHFRSTSSTGLRDGGELSRPTCSITTWTRYLSTLLTGIAVEAMTPNNSVVPWCLLGASDEPSDLVAVAPSRQYMRMCRLVHGDASSTATNPCGKWMTWRCCNQSHNSHTTESCSTGKNQTGFKPIQTDLIPCWRFMSRFRRKTCKPFFHASSKRPTRTRDTRN